MKVHIVEMFICLHSTTYTVYPQVLNSILDPIPSLFDFQLSLVESTISIFPNQEMETFIPVFLLLS